MFLRQDNDWQNGSSYEQDNCVRDMYGVCNEGKL